ncbi:MAG: type II secretion system protein [Planctomycetes bacterium]|nr:type II secretion system protein [Planctomycetota bacterium]
MRRPGGTRGGFTLAEVMVTLLIVSIGLLLITQGLTRARFSAAETHHRKLARELALLTLGRLESGLFWEELDGGDGDVLTGTYAEEGYEEFHYELVLGDEEFRERAEPDGRQGSYHDSWEYEREREQRLRREDDDKDEEEQVAEAFEKVRIKVGYPRFGEELNESELVLERWIPWEQVYGSEEDDSRDAAEADS